MLRTRDGTSQAGRQLAELDPSYVSVDEQTSAELLTFAREYGKALRLYGLSGESSGNFGGFIGSELLIDEVAAFLADPEKFCKDHPGASFASHRVLFFVFLKLLERYRGELNRLTRRHLDFYYRQVLKLALRPSIPDRVNLIFDLSPGVDRVLVPKGSLLGAGPDVAGRDRIYATQRDLIVNGAQLAEARSLFIDRPRTRLQQIPAPFGNDKARACDALCKFVFGDPLEKYPGGSDVNYAKLEQLAAMLRRAGEEFCLSLPELRELLARKALRPPAPAEWPEINAKLEIAGRKRLQGPFQLDPNSRDFAGNLQLAVGSIDLGLLQEVNQIEDLYALRNRPTVAQFIREHLYFDNLDDFAQMMELKRKFVSEWTEINRLLQQAARRKHKSPDYILPIADIADFATNVTTAIGAVDLEGYYAEVRALESYFCLPDQAERFASAMAEVTTKDQSTWTQIFSMLEEAHRQKRRQQRKAKLQALRTANPPARPVDLILHVLGERPNSAEYAKALDRLAPLLGKTDFERLSGLLAAPPLATAPPKEWEAIDALLEFAERNRVGEPSIEKEEWLNLHPAADATVVKKAPPSGGVDLESAPWATFGFSRPQATPLPAPAPVLGFALSSPLLVLSEGQRKITLTLGFAAGSSALSELFKSDPNQAGRPHPDSFPLQFEISTEKGFVPCAPVSFRLDTYAQLVSTNVRDALQAVQFVLSISAGAEPIAALPSETAEGDSPWPTLRLLLRPIYDAAKGQHVARYPELSGLLLFAAHLRVEASGLKSLSLQSDDATPDPKQPFEPFGSLPAVRSRLLLGHPELSGKKLDALSFNLRWMGAPSSLSAHYASYELPSPLRFTVTVSCLDRGLETALASSAQILGESGDAPITIAITTPLSALAEPSSACLARDAEPAEQALAEWPRQLCWELNAPDFQHAAYPSLALNKSLALAIASSQPGVTLRAEDYQLKPPYTPKLASLTIDYGAAAELIFDVAADKATPHRADHVHPFGRCTVEAERVSGGIPFLPRYENDGELYLGLRGLAPPETISLFFQLAEGSANPDGVPPRLRWSYLSGDRFIPLEQNVLSDSTRGFLNSGIVELVLPQAEPSRRMPGELYWVRAAVARDTGSLCQTIGIHTQAVAATFVDRDNAPAHFGSPLPAQTISQLDPPMPEITGVRQPYTSFGGRMAEADAMFDTRVSERLRHKGRALSMWDYERLALDAFPELYKAKCFPASAKDPGQVTLIVIPDIRDRLPADPFAPKAPANLLADIQAYLQLRAPDFVRVVVRNPDYVAVRVRLGVRFATTGNDAFYIKQLTDDLNRFLSPWAYEEGADIVIGGRIYASSIVDFVDRRPYVDYVAGIKLFLSEDGQNFRPAPQAAANTAADIGYAVETPQPEAVLVAARSHEIDVLTGAIDAEKKFTGIEFMKLDLDFIVGEDPPAS